MKQMMTNKMRRRIKRRLKSTEESADKNDCVDKEVTSPPRLRRDSSVNNIAAAAAAAVSTNTGEIAFQLEDSASPVIETFGFGGSSISTLTNDKAFTQKRFDCGFDSEEYAIMNRGSQQPTSSSEQQRQQMLMMNGEKPYLQLQTDGKESGVGCISFGSKNKKKQQQQHQPDSSPIAVNDMDFFNHFDNFDSTTIGSKAIANNNNGSSSSSAHKAGAWLNTTPRRNSKKDDDTFFYSQSEAPSSSNGSSVKLAGESITLASSKLAGESITLASTLSSVRHNNNMNSFDAINDDKLKTLFAEESMKERSRLDTTTYQMGMSRREYHMKDQSSPPASSRSSANYREKIKQQEVQNVPRPTTKESSTPRSSRKSCNRSKKHDIMKRDESWSSSIDSGGSRSSGCGAPPEIVEEIVADVKTVLSSVISTVFLACSESEQCLSRCHHNKPTKTKATRLNSIDEEEFAVPLAVQESSSFIVKEETTGCKPWPGCLNLSPTDETEDVSDVITPREVEYTVDKKQRRPRLVRLKKFLTSPLRRK
jgi:hypothetical protein